MSKYITPVMYVDPNGLIYLDNKIFDDSYSNENLYYYEHNRINKESYYQIIDLKIELKRRLDLLPSEEDFVMWGSVFGGWVASALGPKGFPDTLISGVVGMVLGGTAGYALHTISEITIRFDISRRIDKIVRNGRVDYYDN